MKVWNDYIARPHNRGLDCNFSYSQLKKDINSILNDRCGNPAQIIVKNKACRLHRFPKDCSIIQNSSFKDCNGCGHNVNKDENG